MRARALLLLVCALLAGLVGARASGESPLGPPLGPPPPRESPAGASGLAQAMQRSVDAAVAAAAADGVALEVTSGRRTAAEQQALYDEAVRTHGSAREARRWVLPPGESAHVRGEAVDVGPSAGAAWLARHGERFGLCQRYDIEPWHFERLAGAIGSRCPEREPHP